MKYSQSLKEKIVKDYLTGKYGYRALAKKYQIPDPMEIRRWVTRVKYHGYQSLLHTRNKTYSLDFKLKVVKYYMAHQVGFNEVAAKYNINYSQAYSWYRIYKNEGIVGLRPKPKGRPRKHMNKHKKKIKQSTLTKEEQYKQKIADLEAKVTYQNMELDILKKLHALRKPKNENKLK